MLNVCVYHTEKQEHHVAFFTTDVIKNVSSSWYRFYLSYFLFFQTLAILLSTIPLTARGPSQIMVFDIHALQERFYFTDNVIPR